MSSTEAEFMAASDAGKMALYLRSILAELEVPQDLATPLFEDNNGALMMANAQQRTKRTRHIHMDIRHFSLLDWVEEDLLKLESIDTACNPSDALTKNVPRILYHCHYDILLGRIPPHYVDAVTPET